LEVIEMNPIMMDMVVKANQAEMLQEIRKHRVSIESGKADERNGSLKVLSAGLAATIVIILLVVLAIGIV